jgi:hypothetical protein
VRVEQGFEQLRHCDVVALRPRVRGVIAVWLCSVKNERFWHTFETVSKRRKMAVFLCQNPYQNQSAKTCAVLGFGTSNENADSALSLVPRARGRSFVFQFAIAN